MNYKFWPSYLPEAGRAMDRIQDEMESIQQKIDALNASISLLNQDFKALESEAENMAVKDWSEDEIKAAKNAASQNSNFK